MADPLVVVWPAVSSLVHVTSPPTSTVTSAGIKQLLVSSHPITDEPGALLTSAVGWSAYAAGTA